MKALTVNCQVHGQRRADIEPCWNCEGTGRDGHDCGTFDCQCKDPVDTIPCGLCEGHGHFHACSSCNQLVARAA